MATEPPAPTPVVPQAMPQLAPAPVAAPAPAEPPVEASTIPQDWKVGFGIGASHTLGALSLGSSVRLRSPGGYLFEPTLSFAHHVDDDMPASKATRAAVGLALHIPVGRRNATEGRLTVGAFVAGGDAAVVGGGVVGGAVEHWLTSNLSLQGSINVLQFSGVMDKSAYWALFQGFATSLNFYY